MIEMLGVLAIIGVLSVGGIAGFSKAMAKYRVNKTIDLITMTATNVRTLFSSQKNYNDLSRWTQAGRELVARAKLVPDEAIDIANGENRFSHPFGGEFYLDSDSGGKTFSISLENISTEACIDLVTTSWPDDLVVLAFGSKLMDMGSTNGLLNSFCKNEYASLPKEQGKYVSCKNIDEIPVSVNNAIIGCDCPNSDCILRFVFK